VSLNDPDPYPRKSAHRSRTTTIVVAYQVGYDHVAGKNRWVRDEQHLVVREEVRVVNRWGK